MSTTIDDRPVDRADGRWDGARRPGAGSAGALEPAKAPIGLGPLPVIGVLFSVIAIALGVVALRDALLRAGAFNGTGWIPGAVDRVDGWTPQAWIAIVGVVIVLMGLWLVLAALRPRPRTSIALTAETGVFLTRRGVERIAVNAATDVGGVLAADARASRSRLDLRVSITGGASTTDHVRTALEDALAPLESPPAIRIKTTGGGRP